MNQDVLKKFDDFFEFCFLHGGTLKNHKAFGYLAQQLRKEIGELGENMITAIRYDVDRLARPVEETRFLNPVPKKCDETTHVHYWVTMGFNEPRRGSSCLCGEKEYRGLEYAT